MQDLSEKILDPFLTDDEKRENVFDIPENLMREALKKVFSSDLNIETLIEIYDSCQPSTHPYAGAPASDFIPVAAAIPGCPPRPSEILEAILAVGPQAIADRVREQE